MTDEQTNIKEGYEAAEVAEVEALKTLRQIERAYLSGAATQADCLAAKATHIMAQAAVEHATHAAIAELYRACARQGVLLDVPEEDGRTL